MVDGHLFDTLSSIAQSIRKSTERPFGGVQARPDRPRICRADLTYMLYSWSLLGIFSNYLQLPKAIPNPSSLSKAWNGRNVSSIQSPSHKYFGRKITVRCLPFPGLGRVPDAPVVEFVDLLNSLRMGVASQTAVATFNGLRRPLDAVDGIVPTELFPLRNEVDKANKTKLDALKTEPLIYESRDTGNATEERKATILKNMVAQRVLEIKADAQVMLIKNVDENLVNGSVGRVLGFYMISEVCGSSGEITSKGGNGFIRKVLLEDDGKTPAQKKGVERESQSVDVKPKSKSGSQESTEKFPLVEFRTPLGKEVVLVGRDEFKVEETDGTVVARRVQVNPTSPTSPRSLIVGSRSRWSSPGQCRYTRAKARRSST